MRILLTNDDGITSPGIKLLAVALRNAGHRVFVVAPDVNRSGTSHSISFLSNPLKLSEIEEDTWSCSGTPVDCIITALLGGIYEICIATETSALNMERAPDLILSGINAGANLGTDVVYSGTAAAARQGSFFGIPSVALSLVDGEIPYQWDTIIPYITEKLISIMGYWKAGTFVNVNFPNIEKKPAALVPSFPSFRYYNDRIVSFITPEGGKYCFAKPGKVENIPEDGSDWAEVLKHNAALSVILSQPSVAD
ncbi:MAG: 5'/3'-nucleotidase SurE [Treponema sp.]|nr:5'/3'-nucleotidase SurE [Treponema sp.]MCL2181824.1 5'/3'-nucleotidase SurE [Treponema sp.]